MTLIPNRVVGGGVTSQSLGSIQSLHVPDLPVWRKLE